LDNGGRAARRSSACNKQKMSRIWETQEEAKEILAGVQQHSAAPPFSYDRAAEWTP
jgi:hypothetical protein